LISVFAVLSSLGIYLRTMSLTTFCWYGNRRLQEDMIKQVLNAPVNLYFDTTPIGRILNRFSKDLSVAETVMPWSIGNFYAAFYQLLAVLVLSVVDSPYLIIIFPVISLIIVYYFKKSIAGTKEVARVESVSKSPILGFLSESIAGTSTLRAYGNKD